MAAEFVTPKLMAFIIRCGGPLCVALEGERPDDLSLPLWSPGMTTGFGLNITERAVGSEGHRGKPAQFAHEARADGSSAGRTRRLRSSARVLLRHYGLTRQRLLA